jgi:hypothetical protein
MSAVAKQVISTDQAPAALGPYSQVGTQRCINSPLPAVFRELYVVLWWMGMRYINNLWRVLEL